MSQNPATPAVLLFTSTCSPPEGRSTSSRLHSLFRMDFRFRALLASFAICVSLFARCSEGGCEVNGKTYNIGEAWRQADPHQDCFQHVCLQDGTHTTSKCDPGHNDVKGISTTTVGTSTSTTGVDLTTEESVTDSQDNGSGCTVDGRVVGVGQQVDVPGRCIYRACAGDEQWIMKACPLVGLTPGWILTPEDVFKSYPYCCGRVAPLLDIIPDVISNLQWSVGMKLNYGNNSVDYGNQLTPTQVKAEPTAVFWANPDSFFLLTMVDPDAPSRQNATYRAFLHWLVGNIPGNDVSSGDVLAEYVGSGPPQGSGLHRYVFLLYKQPGNITFEEPLLNNTSAEGRRKFSIGKFSDKYNLSDPISLNFFVAEYDD